MKSSSKIEFVCGTRALADYRSKNAAIYAIGAKLSVRDSEVAESITKLQNNYAALQKQYAQTKNELLSHNAERMFAEGRTLHGITLVSRVFEATSIDDLKTLAQALIQKPSTIALLAAKNDTLQMVFSRSDDLSIDIGSLFKANMSIIEGKGGGSPKSAQGGGIRLDKAEEMLLACESQLRLLLES